MGEAQEQRAPESRRLGRPRVDMEIAVAARDRRPAAQIALVAERQENGCRTLSNVESHGSQ